jgi:uncharacterized repeat protein (TIGR01451 family)
MKKILFRFGVVLGALFILQSPGKKLYAQNATASTPLGIGKNCAGAASTDSFRVLNYNPVIHQLSSLFKCKPNLGGGSPTGPAFSSSAGSVAYNPFNQNIYYIATTTGNNSFVYNWRPDTCHTANPKQLYSKYYPAQFVVGLDFTPLVANDGYQLEFTGATAPYTTFLRKVNFSTNYLGPSDTILFSAGKKIYVQSGDIIFTPIGDLYVAFDNKLFRIDYSTYGTGHVNGTFIDTLNFGAGGYVLTGIANVAGGKFIGSTQSASSCKFVEIDISSGVAVITPVTLPANNFTSTDMATMIAGIGVAKTISSVLYLGSNNYLVYYDVKIRNYGNAYLNNVQLKDSVAKVFGASFFSATVAAVGSLPAGLAINPSYNGNTNCDIFVGGAGSTLGAAPAEEAIVRIAVTLNNPSVNTTYYNTALGFGKNILYNSASVSDSSNNDGALRPDPNNNGVPDDINEDIPTPLRLLDWLFLPVRLIDFNARIDKEKTRLEWSLENTSGHLEINIQRSSDGVNFRAIGKLESSLQQDLQRYQWEDINPENGTNYYRLEIIANGINTFYSGVVKVVVDRTDLTDLKVGPNPFQKSISFSFSLHNTGIVDYRIIDNNRRVIQSNRTIVQKGENHISIENLPAIPDGIYILQIRTEKTVYNKKIIKAG